MSEKKREEYISWEGYFMGLAAMASFRSKDPSTQNGSCVIDPDSKTILAMGYNGFPRGCSDDEFPWDRGGDGIPKGKTKYPYVEHSERNAIYNAARKGISLDGAVIYNYSEKGYYPCDECARAIIQSDIKEVVMGWAMEGNTDVYSWAETLKMFKASGVRVDVLCLADPYSILDREASLRVAEDFDLISKKMRKITTQLEEAQGEE